jgi:hypothetical protein
LRFIATDGQYPLIQFTTNEAPDNAYTRINYAVTWDWHASSKTSIDGFLGHTQQHYKHSSVRDFADVIGEVNLNWRASDKSLIEISARREISQYVDLLSNFLLKQGVWVDLSWHFSPKLAVTLPIFYQQQQFLGNSAGNGTNASQRKDYVAGIGLDLIYKPSENISIGVPLHYENRDSNVALRSYETKSVGINLQVSF